MLGSRDEGVGPGAVLPVGQIGDSVNAELSESLSRHGTNAREDSDLCNGNIRKIAPLPILRQDVVQILHILLRPLAVLLKGSQRDDGVRSVIEFPRTQVANVVDVLQESQLSEKGQGKNNETTHEVFQRSVGVASKSLKRTRLQLQRGGERLVLVGLVENIVHVERITALCRFGSSGVLARGFASSLS